jgi:hypothetical protein
MDSDIRDERPPPAKCAQCSKMLGDGELVVFEHGEFFHRPCWRVGRSQASIRDSAQLVARTRKRLEAQRRDSEPESSSRASAGLAPLVLIVDGDTTAAAEVKTAVAAAGGIATVAHTPADAIQIVRGWTPDLLLLSSDLSSSEVTTALCGPGTRVVKLSRDHNGPEIRDDGLILPKPISPERVRALVVSVQRRPRGV